MNSTVFTWRFGLGVKGGLFVYGALKMHYISSLNQVGHSHLGR